MVLAFVPRNGQFPSGEQICFDLVAKTVYVLTAEGEKFPLDGTGGRSKWEFWEGLKFALDAVADTGPHGWKFVQ